MQVTQMDLCLRICLAPTQSRGVIAFLSGDGKAMISGNFLEGERCWLCDGPSEEWGAKLVPDANFPAGPRYGAYLRCIPPSHRIGDYVHCTCRIVNILLKRLLALPLDRNTFQQMISCMSHQFAFIEYEAVAVVHHSSAQMTFLGMH